MGISSVLKTLFLFLGQLHIAVSWNWIRLSRLKSEKCVGFDLAPSHLSPLLCPLPQNIIKPLLEPLLFVFCSTFFCVCVVIFCSLFGCLVAFGFAPRFVDVVPGVVVATAYCRCVGTCVARVPMWKFTKLPGSVVTKVLKGPLNLKWN